MKKWIYAAAVLGAMQTAGAVGTDGQFHISGSAGSMTCATLATKIGDPQAGQDLSNWIGGFVTAMNLIEPETYDIIGGVPFNDFIGLIIKTCAEGKPEATVASAIYAAITTVAPFRLTEAP